VVVLPALVRAVLGVLLVQPHSSQVSSLRTTGRPSSSGSSDRATSQFEYHDAQSSSAPSVMWKTWWWVSARLMQELADPDAAFVHQLGTPRSEKKQL
jgi:hypothetical protein